MRRLFDLFDPIDIATQFNLAINKQNAAKLSRLMDKRHTFIDSAGNVVEGKKQVLALWQEFFDLYPDYENVFEHAYDGGHYVVALGHSICSHVGLEGPAIWYIKLHNGRVLEWRMFEDTAANRRMLEID